MKKDIIIGVLVIAGSIAFALFVYIFIEEGSAYIESKTTVLIKGEITNYTLYEDYMEVLCKSTVGIFLWGIYCGKCFKLLFLLQFAIPVYNFHAGHTHDFYRWGWF